MPEYKLSANAVLETFDDGGLVLLLPERRLIELNPTAAEIVKLLDGNRTQEQIVSELFKSHEIDHDVSETKIDQDVQELIIELSKIGVLEFRSDLH